MPRSIKDKSQYVLSLFWIWLLLESLFFFFEKKCDTPEKTQEESRLFYNFIYVSPYHRGNGLFGSN